MCNIFKGDKDNPDYENYRHQIENNHNFINLLFIPDKNNNYAKMSQHFCGTYFAYQRSVIKKTNNKNINIKNYEYDYQTFSRQSSD